MENKTSEEHKNNSPEKIYCGIITLSDSRNEKKDISGDYIEKQINERYELISRTVIPDEKKILEESIEKMIKEGADVILTTGGTGISKRDITVECVENLFDKKLDGFGEIFRYESYLEIGSSALISRATAGIYKNCCIFSMPGSPNAVKTALRIIIEELPHAVHHAKK